MSVTCVFTGSLYKPFHDSPLPEPMKEISSLCNSPVCLQAVFRAENLSDNAADAVISVKCQLPFELYEAALVPVMRPAYQRRDEYFLRTEPGLYPDPLIPISGDRILRAQNGITKSVWIIVNPESVFADAGDYEIEFSVFCDNQSASASVTVRVINAALPDEGIHYTNWFHCDCICDAHGCGMFSERHWSLLEKYVALYARSGADMILTPCFTPPLDTPVNGERMTAQLVGVKRTEGKYTFDFSLLGRWIDLCKSAGIKLFEHSHLFTQWGALHAPKIMAETEEGTVRIFGWETDALDSGGEYAVFLRAYLTALTAFLRERGDLERFYFHVSDEPWNNQIEEYKKAKSLIAPYIDGCRQFDALTHPEYIDIADIPVPITEALDKFMGKKDDLWTYYIGSTCYAGYSNRLISMPGARTRILGLQMATHGIKGFLHWGYNFWYTRLSEYQVDPWRSPDNDAFFAGGTSFVVYPGRGRNEGPVASSRLYIFAEGLRDAKAYMLLEKLAGREKAREICPEISFHTVLTDGEMTVLSEKILNAIRDYTEKK